ncbi:tetratricopeptide repeat protein [Thalassoroseus pseudoceratinae]|uniref:tetratricopeptide repeat protein n=1 Tax=Thalassoroseus pseudoceratinae TaxID=2713176 RepID=UPI0014204709|nr:hypothetical protein [Thalassoroseus pseudoceratinae]
MPVDTPGSLASTYSLMEQAEFYQQRGNLAVAKTLWNRIRQEFDTPISRLRFAEFQCAIGEYTVAMEELRGLFRWANDVHDHGLKSVVAHNLAAVHRKTGDRLAAASWQQVAIGQDENSSPADLAGRAEDAFLAGEYELAETLIQRSLDWETEQDHLEGQADDWGMLGLIRAGRDDFNDAKRCLGRAFALHQKCRCEAGMATDLLNLGELFAARSEWTVAERLFQRSQTLANEAGHVVLTERADRRVQQARRILAVAKRCPQWN